MVKTSGLVIRQYQPEDREVVRRLCCETGFLGKPIDPVFEDRELFADYLTSYYTDYEPESSFVLLQGGDVKGYLLGSRHPIRQQIHGLFLNLSLLIRGSRRYWTYGRASRDFVGWILRNSWREVSAAPRCTAHFHINLLPEAQSVAGTRELINRYLAYLRASGEKAVYGQMVTFESRRGSRLFERYGFQIVDKREITKYRKIHPDPVYLTTVIKQIDQESSARIEALPR